MSRTSRFPRNALIGFSLLGMCFHAFTVLAADLTRGRAVYQETCAACHAYGAAGAPRLSERSAWGARIKQPQKLLVGHAINGLNTMPPKGGNPSLSDVDVSNAVAYMLDQLRVASKSDSQPARPSSRPVIPRANTVTAVEYPKSETNYHKPPSDREIPRDKYGDEVRLGQKIFTETHKYAKRYAGNELSCANCHLDAGRKPHSAPMWAAYGMYPAYRAKNDRSNTLEERIQQCFRFSLNGIAPTLDAPEMRTLVSYFHYLAKGVPVGVDLPGRGYPQIAKTGYDPNPTRGADVYRERCTLCHGKDGHGQKKEGGGYVYPPLWGIGSYNKGAGMAQTATLAGFIKANMPLGQDWSLSDQEVLDVAAYINLQLRPWDPRKGVIRGLFN